MFEKSFLPFLKSSDIETLNDPIDEFMNLHFNRMQTILKDNNYDSDKIQDYELMPTRRAKILLQTVSHVSGAAFFYQYSKLKSLNNNNKLSMGVCLHPKYGGWFAMRGVFIFKNILAYDLISKIPQDVLNNDESRIIDLLNKFNTNWKDNSYRDVITVENKYSKKQIEYFTTEPSDRKKLIKKWLTE